MRREDVIRWLQEQMDDAMDDATESADIVASARVDRQIAVARLWRRDEEEQRFVAGVAVAAINHLNGVSPE